MKKEKYAIIKIAGSQFKVAEGDEIKVNKVEAKKDGLITIQDVLLIVEGDKIKIGQPLVKGASVKAKVLDQLKDKKIRVATYKSKSKYRRVKGSRALLTKLKIEKITSA